jgi:hypothetical protein
VVIVRSVNFLSSQVWIWIVIVASVIIPENTLFVFAFASEVAVQSETTRKC